MLPLLVCVLGLGALAADPLQATTVEWLYVSEALSCDTCGAELGKPYTSFVCSNDTSTLSPAPRRPEERSRRGGALPPAVVSSWNGGTLSFADPIDPNLPVIVRNVVVTMDGRFNCGSRCQLPADYILLLNDVAVANGQFPIFPNATCGCHCGNCGFPLVFQTGYQGGAGWTAYNRGQDNSMQLFLPLFFQKSVVCLSRVNLTLLWEVAQSNAVAVAFFPKLGPTSGGSLVNISGFNFDPFGQYTCAFGSQVVTAEFVSVRMISCLSPPWFRPNQNGPFTPVALVVADDVMGVISNFTLDYLYYREPVVTALSPRSGNVSGGALVYVMGTGFINTLELVCHFGDNPPQTATFINSTRLSCIAPPWSQGEPAEIPVEVSENGNDFTDNEVLFRYDNVPVLGVWQLWQLIALIVGVVVGAALVIVIAAACVYRRARDNDKSRRYLDSDSESETEPLISAISSKAMRQVLAKVERVEVSDLKIDRRIGRGSFGEVFHARWAGTDIAVKKLPKHMLTNQKFLEDFAQEISIMAALRHPNVLQFLGVAVDKVSLYMLTEYMPRGSLYDVLHHKEQLVPIDLAARMLLDTSRGMTYLHKRLIHRDLKSHNLLVGEHWNVKICDFGLSRLKQVGNTMTACGTPCWTAPEVLRNEHYTEKADVYSFAIVIWECLTREDPFAGMPPFHVVFVVGTQNARPEIPPKRPEWPQALLDLMVHAWQEDPELRPQFVEVTVTLQSILGIGAEEEMIPDDGSIN
jgi:hypothetical protein